MGVNKSTASFPKSSPSLNQTGEKRDGGRHDVFYVETFIEINCLINAQIRGVGWGRVGVDKCTAAKKIEVQLQGVDKLLWGRGSLIV